MGGHVVADGAKRVDVTRLQVFVDLAFAGGGGLVSVEKMGKEEDASDTQLDDVADACLPGLNAPPLMS
jgi:hypothetical protein